MNLPKKKVKIGKLVFGEGVLVQSMTNTKTSEASETVKQILALEEAGCDVVRVSVPDEASADAIPVFKRACRAPIVADIHFDHKLAIRAVERGADKIRINPGNLGGTAAGPEKRLKLLREVVACAREHNVPIRVGVNAGSLEEDLLKQVGRTAEALAESALRNVRMLEDLNFEEIVVSVKSSSVLETIAANRLLAASCRYPLHVGVTEAGTRTMGTVKSDVAIGALLAEGIGDTVRVSLAGDPVFEVVAARNILRAVGIEKNFVEVVACPTCSRTCIPVEALALRVEEYAARMRVPLKIAVMGCVVNGIGESKGADFGIAGGPERSVLFSDGEPLETVDNEQLFEVIKREIDRRGKID